ncbi:hypothetical protein LCGC14_2367440 [marine sediment metagenome]|uniref:Uncharacterized protein n=1 Tax=marine sediment metagenome TaxID=412755 RepID=A0A0F9CS22_9ZZZZ
MVIQKEVNRERQFKSGYILRTEMWSTPGCPPVEMKSCYTPDGHYIGGAPWGHRLCTIRGIRPELRTAESNTCSIGFCEREQKWYGWSHRAIYGFSIGDKVKEGDVTAEHLPIGFKAETLNDAKKMADAFARSVS